LNCLLKAGLVQHSATGLTPSLVKVGHVEMNGMCYLNLDSEVPLCVVQRFIATDNIKQIIAKCMHLVCDVMLTSGQQNVV
jgi:hypothetical protein